MDLTTYKKILEQDQIIEFFLKKKKIIPLTVIYIGISLLGIACLCLGSSLSNKLVGLMMFLIGLGVVLPRLYILKHPEPYVFAVDKTGFYLYDIPYCSQQIKGFHSVFIPWSAILHLQFNTRGRDVPVVTFLTISEIYETLQQHTNQIRRNTMLDRLGIHVYSYHEDLILISLDDLDISLQDIQTLLQDLHKSTTQPK